MASESNDRDADRGRHPSVWGELHRQRDLIQQLRALVEQLGREQAIQDTRMKLLASLAFFVVGSVLPLTVVLWQAFGAR